jgi:catechol-2,3-dioxygenase
MTGIASLGMLDLECHDPRVMGDFYSQVLGWDVILSQDEYVEISDGSTRILFTRAFCLAMMRPKCGQMAARTRTTRSD